MSNLHHVHNEETFYANGKLVCTKCAKETGQNECFCKCHKLNELPGQGVILKQCQKCAVFHK